MQRKGFFLIQRNTFALKIAKKNSRWRFGAPHHYISGFTFKIDYIV